jgi:hypothetical protein
MDELENELQQDAIIEMSGDQQVPCIADMKSDDVDALVNSGMGQVILQQLIAGLLGGLHPLRQHELTISDEEIRAGMKGLVEIDRYADFYRMRLVMPASEEDEED